MQWFCGAICVDANVLSQAQVTMNDFGKCERCGCPDVLLRRGQGSCCALCGRERTNQHLTINANESLASGDTAHEESDTKVTCLFEGGTLDGCSCELPENYIPTDDWFFPWSLPAISLATLLPIPASDEVYRLRCKSDSMAEFVFDRVEERPKRSDALR